MPWRFRVPVCLPWKRVRDALQASNSDGWLGSTGAQSPGFLAMTSQLRKCKALYFGLLRHYPKWTVSKC